jgi:tetratricopeptide (TPR) repeat protein
MIVFAAVAVYFNSLSCPFIFDDLQAIRDNPTLRDFHSALSLSQKVSGVEGRPLVNLSLALNYAVGGLQVWGYHAVNLAIHILAGLTLFGIVRRSLLSLSFAEALEGGQRYGGQALQQPALSDRFGEASLPLAFVVALLWTVHPLQTESVTCVIQRTESLMGLFYLATLYCFVRGAENRSQEPGVRSQEKRSGFRSLASSLWPVPSGLWFLASILCCALGMATKEVMVSAPLIVLLYDRTFLAGTFREAWRRRRGWYLGLFGTWLVLGSMVVRMGGSRGEAAGLGHGIPPWAYALTQCRAIVLYLRLAVWPHPLVLDYGMDVVQHVAAVVPQVIILALLVAGTIFMLRHRPAVGFAGAWFFAILAPSSSVVPLPGQTIAEHRMYLPLAAVITLVVLGLYARIGPRSLIIFAASSVGLGWLTIQRNHDYRSEVAIWSDTVAKCPDNVRARNNLGYALSEIPGRLPDAIAAYEAALRMDPEYAGAHTNLGAALAGIPGREPEAIAHFEAALRIKPDSAAAHYNLGCILANIPGRLPEAMVHFEAVFRMKPDDVTARNNLGLILYKNGRIPEAIAQFGEAVRINPDYADAHYNLGVALDQAGRIPEAMAQFEEAVAIDPDYAEAHYDLGIAFARRGQIPEAIAQFEEVVRIKPGDAAAHSNLGVALGQAGRIPEAMAQFKEVLRIKPDSPDARAFLEKLQKAER